MMAQKKTIDLHGVQLLNQNQQQHVLHVAPPVHPATTRAAWPGPFTIRKLFYSSPSAVYELIALQHGGSSSLNSIVVLEQAKQLRGSPYLLLLME
jgi:hypothetical protein